MAVAAASGVPLWHWSLDEYHLLGEGGILGEDDRVELLEGVLVEMTPISAGHQYAVDLLNEHFAGTGDWLVRVQGPLTFAAETSEPQPDLSLIARAVSREAHPSTAFLVIEVAVTPHVVDREIKAPLYARAGVPEYWLVDLPGRAVEVRRSPQSGAYQELTTFGPNDVLRPATVDAPPLELAPLLALGDA